MKFIKEAEYKYLNRTKNYEDKIRDFFGCIKLIKDVEDVNFEELFNISRDDDSEDSDDN